MSTYWQISVVGPLVGESQCTRMFQDCVYVEESLALANVGPFLLKVMGTKAGQFRHIEKIEIKPLEVVAQ